jgi:uncharacterized surface protein with fasciclin (FAS1) repeats
LAPNNDALGNITSNNNFNSNNPDDSVSSPGYLKALLDYHILNGTYYASNITDTSQFVPTKLTNESYTNVTGGQRVECSSHNDNVTFISAWKQNVSVVNSVCAKPPNIISKTTTRPTS